MKIYGSRIDAHVTVKLKKKSQLAQTDDPKYMIVWKRQKQENSKAIHSCQ